MTVDSSTLLFFDASCLIAAAGSAQGGSGFLLSLCRKRWLAAAVSHVVLLEAERNLAAKRGPRELARYHELLAQIPWVLAAVPEEKGQAAWSQLINPKDHHVIAATLACGAEYLLTLDRGLLREVEASALPIVALDPGTFIKRVLPEHDAL
jgi:predicted nucleic acid-binding protein